MRHLVLGSDGQIGLYLCEVLKESNLQYLEYDISKNPKQDLRKSSDYLRYCIEESDYIYFLAFDVGGSRYLKEREGSFEFIHNNMAILYNTFDILKDYPGKRLLFTSSQMSNMSHSTYGRLKSVGESYTLAYGGLVTKFWNVYGIERDPDKFHVITDFVRSALNTGEIRMMTSGEESRQFLSAWTASLAMIELLCTNAYNNISLRDNLHITSFRWNTIYEVAQIIAEITERKTGRKINIIKGESLDEVQKNLRNEPDEYILEHTSFWCNEELSDLKIGIESIVDYEIKNQNSRS